MTSRSSSRKFQLAFSSRETRGETRETRWVAWTRESGALALCLLGIIATASTLSQNLYAQTARSGKVATLEEASGTSIKDFNALRALSSDYLDNPDGGETPDDEEEWSPNLSLVKKPNSAPKSSTVRVISFENGQAKTSVRTATTNARQPVNANDLQKKNGIAQAQYLEQTPQPAQEKNYRVSQPQHNFRPGNATQNTIRQTAGFADYSIENIENSNVGGFGDYQQPSASVPLVAMQTEIPQKQQPVGDANLGFATTDDVTAPHGNLPDFNNLPEIEPFPTPQQALAYPQNATSQLETTTNQNPLYLAPNPTLANPTAGVPETNQVLESGATAVIATNPNATTQIDATTNAAFPTASTPIVATAPQALALDSFPTISDATLGFANESIFSNPEQTLNPAVAREPAMDETPMVASRFEIPQEALTVNATNLTAPEKEVDNTVVTEQDAPFRESFNAVPREEYSTQTYLEKNLPLETTNQEAQLERNKTQSLEASKLTDEEKRNLIVEDIRISGLEMSTQQFNKIVRTRIGAKFNQQRLEEDKRALIQTKQFIDVEVSTSYSADNPGKVVVNFDLTPRRMMRYVKVVGNRLISKHDILEELGMRPGESRMDPYEVENGKIRIIEFYKSKDYGEPHVEILRGDHPEDVGVVYLIDEGRRQRVLRTKFVGNTVVSEARLRNLVDVKPGILYFIGGAFTRERLDADVQKLLEYYRNLGYFDARIDREYEESAWFGGLGKDNAWVSVRYIINEGPRYRIRNFSFSGNRVVSSDELKAKLKVKSGQYYDFGEIEADRIALRYKYQDLGYVRADITPNQVFTDEVGVVDIRYDIVEDHRYRVKEVVVDYVGGKNQKTVDARTKLPVVLNQLDITPGELLNGKKIRMSENTLRQSGLFNDDPAQGQLPEIAVIPDESKSYVLQKKGDAQFVKEARRNDDEEESQEDENSDATTRGQTTERVTRGQTQDARLQPISYPGAQYVSYDAARRATEQNAQAVKPTNVAQSNKTAFQSYGPSVGVAQGQTPSAPRASATSDRDAGKTPPPSGLFTWSFGWLRPQYDGLVRGQTRSIPAGFSTVTTQGNSGAEYGYKSYDDAPAPTTSQYSTGMDYANYESANLLNPSYTQSSESSAGTYLSSSDVETAPGFSDGVYNSLGREALPPTSPEEDEIYDGTVLVKLQEGRTGMFQASIGVNSDYGLVGNVSFTERNFDLFRFPTALFRCDGWKDAWRGGGQVFNVQASPGTNVQSYRVSWDVPNVFDTKYLFGVTGLYGEHSYDEWFEARYGGEIRVGRQWTNRFSTTINAGLYNVKIKDPAVPFVPDLNAVLGTNRLYNIGLTATYDTRNHPFSPSGGYLLKGSFEQAFGDYQFPRVTLDARYYKTLRKRVDGTGRWVLGLSSRMGWTGDKTPIFERYYGGGSTNLRGFEYREVTPRYLQTGFGVGGKFEFYNTAELYIPVSGGDAFQFVVFCDTGTVSEKIKHWGRYRVAPGVGLRFSIPMLGPAPLALDFAFPVSRDKSDVTQVFTFNLSGSR